jgi:hypothetical protein
LIVLADAGVVISKTAIALRSANHRGDIVRLVCLDGFNFAITQGRKHGGVSC